MADDTTLLFSSQSTGWAHTWNTPASRHTHQIKNKTNIEKQQQTTTPLTATTPNRRDQQIPDHNKSTTIKTAQINVTAKTSNNPNRTKPQVSSRFDLVKNIQYKDIRTTHRAHEECTRAKPALRDSRGQVPVFNAKNRIPRRNYPARSKLIAHAWPAVLTDFIASRVTPSSPFPLHIHSPKQNSPWRVKKQINRPHPTKTPIDPRRLYDSKSRTTLTSIGTPSVIPWWQNH